MTEASALPNGRPSPWWAPVFVGLRGVSWLSVGLIVAINTGIALILYTEETRAFWHPLITAQCCGLVIAYAVNAAAPWDKPHPVLRLIAAVVVGSAIGLTLVFAIKGYLIGDENYRLGSGLIDTHRLCWTMISSCMMGTFISLFFMLKFQEARARAQMLKADADRATLSKQAIEAELKLMQAQVEPHFLFNTLASVQFLTETDPPKANLMLGHLLAYLRAALPQLRSDSISLGQETDLAQAYLSIMQMRMGSRLAFVIDMPATLREHRFVPMLLLSLVENAIKHGLEPRAEGGTIRLEARRSGNRLTVTVVDDGRGLRDKIGNGVGLTNLRDRLRALYGANARFSLEETAPHGARATIEIPFDDHAQ